MSGAGGKVVSNAIPEALEAIAVQTGGFDASIGRANAGMVQQSLKQVVVSSLHPFSLKV